MSGARSFVPYTDCFKAASVVRYSRVQCRSRVQLCAVQRRISLVQGAGPSAVIFSRPHSTTCTRTCTCSYILVERVHCHAALCAWQQPRLKGTFSRVGTDRNRSCAALRSAHVFRPCPAVLRRPTRTFSSPLRSLPRRAANLLSTQHAVQRRVVCRQRSACFRLGWRRTAGSYYIIIIRQCGVSALCGWIGRSLGARPALKDAHGHANERRRSNFVQTLNRAHLAPVLAVHGESADNDRIKL